MTWTGCGNHIEEILTGVENEKRCSGWQSGVCETLSVFSSIAVWQNLTPQQPPTENMMRWMSAYTSPCSSHCCRSVDCACIRCGFCNLSLTSNAKAAERYECADCMPIGEQDMKNHISLVSGTTMCSNCFHGGHADTATATSDVDVATGSTLAPPHEHSAHWCKIDINGIHTAVARPVAATANRTLVEGDFIPLPRHRKVPTTTTTTTTATATATAASALDESIEYGECLICCRPFYEATDDGEDEVVPVSPAFCSRSHGIALKDTFIKAYVDTHTHMCSTCALMNEKINKRDVYSDPTIYCIMCKQEQEEGQWRKEFQEEYMKLKGGKGTPALSIQEVSDRFAALWELHQQPWIRDILNETFTKRNSIA